MMVKESKPAALRKKTSEELAGMVLGLKAELYAARRDMVFGRLDDTQLPKKLRHEIARVNTIMNERRLAAARRPETGGGKGADALTYGKSRVGSSAKSEHDNRTLSRGSIIADGAGVALRHLGFPTMSIGTSVASFDEPVTSLGQQANVTGLQRQEGESASSLVHPDPSGLILEPIEDLEEDIRKVDLWFNIPSDQEVLTVGVTTPMYMTIRIPSDSSTPIHALQCDIDVTVSVHSAALSIDRPGRSLTIPAETDSSKLRFDVTPLVAGEACLTVMIVQEGTGLLLQELNLSVEVVPELNAAVLA